MAGITWLHLSDWHQAGKDFDRQIVREALLQDIRNRTAISADLEHVDFIVFSGDLAHGGKAGEYEAAFEYLLDPIRQLAGLEPEQLIVVPGNHDIDRDLLELVPCEIARPFKDRVEVNRWLQQSPRHRSRLLEPFEAFTASVSRHLAPNRSADAHVVRMEAGRSTIAVLALNSAIMCGRNKDQNGVVNDEKQLVVGEPQVQSVLKDAEGAQLVIGVLHHPFEWLAPFDRTRVEETMFRRCHFILCGHQHEPKINFISGSDGSYVIVPAGASYDRRDTAETRYMNSYNFVHLDLDAGEGTGYLRRWSDQRGEWIKHEDAVGDGLFHFALPKEHRRRPAQVTAIKPRTFSGAQMRTFHDQQYVLVPSGPFWMGTRSNKSFPGMPVDQLGREQPARRVTVADFYIGRFPVTNAQYERFVRATGHGIPFRDDPRSRHMGWDPTTGRYPPGRSDHPVVMVSWHDAVAFCRWLGGRLPTEAQWEKAARGGRSLEWPFGDLWNEQFCNSSELKYEDTTTVGTFSPHGDSRFGIADLAGNVMEWCSTLYRSYPYRPEDGRESPDTPAQRVVRGGAWALDRVAARCAFRHGVNPSDHGPTIGFRVVFDDIPV
jgi:formylglycine-generating enzyme required for sulfatase activity/predicted phosphodiesterase